MWRHCYHSPCAVQWWQHGAVVHDAFNLQRFVHAQDPLFAEVLLELERGRKRTHWKPGRSAHEIFGSPDDMKLRSCLTLFELAASEEPLFRRCLAKYCAGQPDELTLDLCRSS